MDILEVDNIPELGKEPMQRIYDLQIEVLTEYQKIESLPDWPIDLEDKENQVLVRDFASRFIEELGEAFECVENIVELIPDYIKLKGKGGDTSDIEKMMLNRLYDFNEELSDALHFMIELNLFSDIPVQDMVNYADAMDLACTCDEYNMDILYFLKAGVSLIADRKDLRPQETPIAIHNDKSPFIRGGRLMNKEVMNNIAKLMWEITYEVKIACNQLKKKPWKQTDTKSNVVKYRRKIMMANFKLFSLFKYLGMDSKCVFEVYYRKNRINLHRIQSKY